MPEKILLSPEHSDYLGNEVAELLGIERGFYEEQPFADGENGMKLGKDWQDSLQRKDVIVLGGAEDGRAHATFRDLMYEMQRRNTHSLHGVCTYMGFARQEREGKPGEFPRGLYRMFEMYQTQPTRLSFVELHQAGIMNIGHPTVNPHRSHVRSTPLILDTIRKNFDLDTIVPTSPDEGRAKYVANIAKELSTSTLRIPHVVLEKDRTGLDQVEVHPISIDYRGKIALIIDDLLNTGGTVIAAAERCLEANASEAIVIATHAVLPQKPQAWLQGTWVGERFAELFRKHVSAHPELAHPELDAVLQFMQEQVKPHDSAEKLQASAISKIFVTNTHRRSQELGAFPKFNVLSIAKLVSEEVKKYWID